MNEPVNSVSAQQGVHQLDINKVMSSYSRQISDQANQIAIKDAIIETQQEEIVKLRELLDEFGKTVDQHTAPAPTKRTTPKKGK